MGQIRVVVNGTSGAVTLSWDVNTEWRVTCEMVRTASSNGRMVVARLEVEPSRPIVPEEGLTADVLRTVRLGRARAYAALNSPSRPQPVPKSRPSGRSPGRPQTLTPGFYARVFGRYSALILSEAKDPAKTLAAEFGYGRPAMRSVIYRAKKMHERQTATTRRGRA